MKILLKKSLSMALSLSLMGAFTACGESGSKETTVPPDYQWAVYDSTEDAPFLPKDIFSENLFVPGLVPEGGNSFVLTDEQETGAFVLKGEYGKCYEVKIPAGSAKILAFHTETDPTTVSVGYSLGYNDDTKLFSSESGEAAAFMYTCRKQEECLVVYTGTRDAIYIGERNILAKTDTAGPWYVPETVGSIAGDCTWGNYNWTAQELIDNLYEPVRKKYPNYITREVIGKDASGKYDMYGYIYAPQNYEITMFITGGMHGSEEVGYYALPKVMQLIAEATAEDVLLYTLRQKVRFVVVPLINVWGVSQDHTGKAGIEHARIRKNFANVDLNRDFGDLSQQESQNVMKYFARFAEDAVIAMDFHTASTKNIAMWYNFINFTDNSVANYKTVNHMYHRYVELGCSQTVTELKHVPGSYKKSDKYIEGRIWNQYGVPTITVEHVVNDNFPTIYSSECMTLAVENYSNFIIQNALFYLQ